MTDTDTAHITSATQAARDARAFATLYLEDTADEMRVLSAWFGYWGGLITEESRIRAVDGPEAATFWCCDTDGHETEPAVTEYPDGVCRCRWCYINDAAIRRAEADLPAMAPAIEGPGPAVLADTALREVRAEMGYYLDRPQYDINGHLEPTDEEVAAAMAEPGAGMVHGPAEPWWTTWPRPAPDMPDTWLPWPPSFAAVLEPDAAAMASGPWPKWVDADMRPISDIGEYVRTYPCQQADAAGSGSLFDWKTTPPISWTDMPPVSRRMRFWYAATDPILAFGRWMVRPLVSPLLLVAVLAVAAALVVWRR